MPRKSQPSPTTCDQDGNGQARQRRLEAAVKAGIRAYGFRPVQVCKNPKQSPRPYYLWRASDVVKLLLSPGLPLQTLPITNVSVEGQRSYCWHELVSTLPQYEQSVAIAAGRLSFRALDVDRYFVRPDKRHPKKEEVTRLLQALRRTADVLKVSKAAFEFAGPSSNTQKRMETLKREVAPGLPGYLSYDEYCEYTDRLIDGLTVAHKFICARNDRRQALNNEPSQSLSTQFIYHILGEQFRELYGVAPTTTEEGPFQRFFVSFVSMVGLNIGAASIKPAFRNRGKPS